MSLCADSDCRDRRTGGPYRPRRQQCGDRPTRRGGGNVDCPAPSIHNTEPITMDDVIIIGGSFAGLAGALQLGRARRKVTVLDTGLPRNRFAGHSHGLLGHDHKPPLHILAEARQQLARYPAIKMVNARADSVSGAIDNFTVLTGDGQSLGARRVILSYGVTDQMPDVPGFAE